MSGAFTSDILKGTPGRTMRGISTKCQEPSMQRVAGAGGSSLQFKAFFFEWFIKFQDTVLSGLGRRYYTSAN